MTANPAGSLGTQYAYDAGSSIELVQVVTYDLVAAGNSYPNRPYLRRRVSGVTYNQAWHAMMAGDIVGLSAVVDADYSFTLSVTSRTAEKALYFTGGEGDGYRRVVISGTVALRN